MRSVARCCTISHALDSVCGLNRYASHAIPAKVRYDLPLRPALMHNHRPFTPPTADTPPYSHNHRQWSCREGFTRATGPCPDLLRLPGRCKESRPPVLARQHTIQFLMSTRCCPSPSIFIHTSSPGYQDQRFGVRWLHLFRDSNLLKSQSKPKITNVTQRGRTSCFLLYYRYSTPQQHCNYIVAGYDVELCLRFGLT